MNKVRALIAKLFPRTTPEAVIDTPDSDIEAGFRRLVVNDNYWRLTTNDSQDNLTFDDAVSTSMSRFKAYPEELRSKIMKNQYRDVIESVMLGWTEANFNEFFAYRKELGEDTQVAEQLLAGIHRYTQLPSVDDFTTTDDATQEQVKALITAARNLPTDHILEFRLGNKEYAWGIMLSDDEFVGFVMENPQHINVIVDTIRERKSRDIALLREQISGKTLALCGGML